MSQEITVSTATKNYNIGFATIGESNNICHAYEAAIKCFNAYVMTIVPKTLILLYKQDD